MSKKDIKLKEIEFLKLESYFALRDGLENKIEAMFGARKRMINERGKKAREEIEARIGQSIEGYEVDFENKKLVRVEQHKVELKPGPVPASEQQQSKGKKRA